MRSSDVITGGPIRRVVQMAGGNMLSFQEQVGSVIDTAAGKWWVLHTRARAEKVVAAALRGAGVHHYLPLVRSRRKYGKRVVDFTLPLFPGYVFLCGDDRACEVAWRTNRVAKVLRVADQEKFRAELWHIYRVVESGRSVDLYPALREGRRCRIRMGCLRDVEGVVLRRKSTCRMYIAATVLGQSAVIEVDCGMLEPVD